MATTKEQPRQQQPQKQQPQTAGPPARSGGPLSVFRDEMNRLFDRFFVGWPAAGGERADGWGMDVSQDEGEVTVRAEAPGFEPNDFDVQIRGDQLILRASHKDQSEQGGYREWSRQEFYRTIPVPQGTEPDKVNAEYRNGVLTVKLPVPEQHRPRRIEVKG